MSEKKKTVKRRPRVLEARDLMTVTGGANLSLPNGPTVGMFTQGPRNPWGPKGPTIGGPTIGFAPTGPRNPLGEK